MDGSMAEVDFVSCKSMAGIYWEQICLWFSVSSCSSVGRFFVEVYSQWGI